MSLTAMDTAVFWSHAFDPELPCESKHEVSTCSGPATHVVSDCTEPSFLICDSAAAINRDRMANRRSTCKHCRKPASACWILSPI